MVPKSRARETSGDPVSGNAKSYSIELEFGTTGATVKAPGSASVIIDRKFHAHIETRKATAGNFPHRLALYVSGLDGVSDTHAEMLSTDPRQDHSQSFRGRTGVLLRPSTSMEVCCEKAPHEITPSRLEAQGTVHSSIEASETCAVA